MNPETLEHILLQAFGDYDDFRFCGCPIGTPDLRYCCDYHIGYDDGVDRIRAMLGSKAGMDAGPSVENPTSDPADTPMSEKVDLYLTSTNADIAAQIEEAIIWRDWQTVEILMNEQDMP